MSYLNVDLPVYKPQIPENKINIDETDLSSWEIASAQQEEINQKKVTEEHKAAESIAKKKEFESMQSEYNAAIAKLDRTKDLQEKYTILENLRQAVNNARYSESRQKILPLLEPVYQQIKTAKEKQDEEIAEFEDKFVKDLNSMKKMQQSNLPDDVKQKYLSSFKEKWKDIIKNFDKRKYTIRFNKLLNLPIPSLPTVIFYLSKNIKIEMVNIPDKDYIIGKYEITQEQWQAVMGNNPSIFKGSQLPVENVSWEDCQEFIKKINSEIKTQSPIKFRLPTEDEWEYCAFGIEKYEYAGSNNINDVAWYNNNSGGKTNQVGKLLPNDFDLYDMSGNVWEWCEDLFYSFNSRVIKGGSWAGASIVSKVKYRYGYDKNHKVNHIGFRLIADLR
ncbi:MAG TPA: SUMF1/EgtB/PvdO family nonheme iron enzyme [bacterium]|nr:SUMF1/EgtB/PvdO family nonheme iron enzyme [bacterium]